MSDNTFAEDMQRAIDALPTPPKQTRRTTKKETKPMPTQTTTLPSDRMTLAAIQRGKRPAPDRILLVGTDGIGKSTFAASAPAPIFIAAEDGVRHLDVASFPEPKTFSEVIDALRVLVKDPHDFKTAVLDSLDWIEPLCWTEACAENGWTSIEQPGYGKGYSYATEKWRALLAALDVLRERRGMEVILIAHATIKPFDNPAGANYSRYECKLQKSAAALVREWCDANLFAVHEEFVAEAKGFNKAKGVSTGRRVLKTVRCAAWDAKNRYGLPEELPLSYEDYAAARDAGMTAPPEALLAEAEELLKQLPEDIVTKAKAALVQAGKDPSVLARIVDRLRTRVAEQPAKEESK